MDSLYAVENAVSVLCRSCKRPIDVWLTHGVRLNSKEAFLEPGGKELCLECLWNTLSSDERARLMATFIELQKLTQGRASLQL